MFMETCSGVAFVFSSRLLKSKRKSFAGGRDPASAGSPFMQ